jgi:hypothetical protein
VGRGRRSPFASRSACTTEPGAQLMLMGAVRPVNRGAQAGRHPSSDEIEVQRDDTEGPPLAVEHAGEVGDLDGRRRTRPGVHRRNILMGTACQRLPLFSGTALIHASSMRWLLLPSSVPAAGRRRARRVRFSQTPPTPCVAPRTCRSRKNSNIHQRAPDRGDTTSLPTRLSAEELGAVCGGDARQAARPRRHRPR